MLILQANFVNQLPHGGGGCVTLFCGGIWGRFLGKCCGDIGLTVETQLDFGLDARGPRLLAPVRHVVRTGSRWQWKSG